MPALVDIMLNTFSSPTLDGGRAEGKPDVVFYSRSVAGVRVPCKDYCQCRQLVSHPSSAHITSQSGSGIRHHSSIHKQYLKARALSLPFQATTAMHASIPLHAFLRFALIGPVTLSPRLANLEREASPPPCIGPAAAAGRSLAQRPCHFVRTPAHLRQLEPMPALPARCAAARALSAMAIVAASRRLTSLPSGLWMAAGDSLGVQAYSDESRA
ncbi:hypothetical protein Q7P37_011348 [Cladosporium fusiforme]